MLKVTSSDFLFCYFLWFYFCCSQSFSPGVDGFECPELQSLSLLCVSVYSVGIPVVMTSEPQVYLRLGSETSDLGLVSSSVLEGVYVASLSSFYMGEVKNDLSYRVHKRIGPILLLG